MWHGRQSLTFPAMGIDASQLLGAPQLAGVKVNPKGAARKQVATAGIGGLVGAAFGMRAAKRQKALGTETPDFGRLGYVAVTSNEIALVKLKSGMLRVKLHEVIARVPRSEVLSAEIGRGIAPGLTIALASGGHWRLEFPRASAKSAREVVHLLSG